MLQTIIVNLANLSIKNIEPSFSQVFFLTFFLQAFAICHKFFLLAVRTKIYFFYFLKDFVNDLTLLFYILFYDINKQQLYTKVSKFLHSIVGFLDHISEKN